MCRRRRQALAAAGSWAATALLGGPALAAGAQAPAVVRPACSGGLVEDRLAASSEASLGALPQAMSWEAVAEDLWVLPAVAPAPVEANGDNLGRLHSLVAVRDGARLWWVGSGPTPAFARSAACALAARLPGLAVTDVINVLAQPEAVMGNAALGTIRLWALEGVAREMRARCPDCVQRLRAHLGDAAGASLVAEAIRVPDRLLRGTAGRLGPFDWWAQPRGGRSACVVLLHRASGLWLLDGWLWGGALPDLRDADALDFSRRLGVLQAHIAARSGPAARLLGGQGPVTGLGALADHRDYLDDLAAAVRGAYARGDAEGAATASAAARLPDRQAARVQAQPVLHQLNWQRLWRAVEDEALR